MMLTVKKIFLLLLQLILVIPVAAQSFVRPSNYWENIYYVNPASINDQLSADATLAVRKQWVNFPGAPTSLFLTGTLYNDDLHTQFGLRLLRDKVGYTSMTNIDLSYAYSVRLDRGWRLNMGLAAAYQNLSYDIAQVTFPTKDDPTIYERLMNKNGFNANVGTEISGKCWKIGAAGQNLFSLFSSAATLNPNTNLFYLKYRQQNQSYLNLGYGGCVFQSGKTVQGEFNITGYFKKTDAKNGFHVGFLYRTWTEIGLILGVDLNKNLRLSYSYDYNAGGISHNSIGSHEVVVGYRLERVWRCHNCWF